jgi:hypothetical protein
MSLHRIASHRIASHWTVPRGLRERLQATVDEYAAAADRPEQNAAPAPAPSASADGTAGLGDLVAAIKVCDVPCPALQLQAQVVCVRGTEAVRVSVTRRHAPCRDAFSACQCERSAAQRSTREPGTDMHHIVCIVASGALRRSAVSRGSRAACVQPRASQANSSRALRTDSSVCRGGRAGWSGRSHRPGIKRYSRVLTRGCVRG